MTSHSSGVPSFIATWTYLPNSSTRLQRKIALRDVDKTNVEDLVQLGCEMRQNTRVERSIHDSSRRNSSSLFAAS
eukprot:691416-Rhodomonas_salina.2